MTSAALFFAAEPRELRAPDFFLAFLVGDECLQRCEIDEPEAIDELAVDEFGAGEARHVVRSHLHDACSVARAQVGDAVNDDFSGRHEQTIRLQGLQSFRGVHCSITVGSRE